MYLTIKIHDIERNKHDVVEIILVIATPRLYKQFAIKDQLIQRNIKLNYAVGIKEKIG